MNHQDIENSKNISVTQEGGAVQIEGVKLQYVGDAFNSYNLTLNVLLPSNGTIDAVSINKNLKLKLRCNKKIIVYEENLPLCELNNTDPANPQGLCFQMYNDDNAQFIMYQYNDRSTIENPFRAVGKYNSSAFRTDYWDFDFFITTPASPLGNKQSLIEDINSIKDAFDQFKQTHPGKPSYCILTLIPGGWVKVTIKGLRIQPDVSSIDPPSLRLTFDIINDMESPSAKTSNQLANECLKNVKKYGPTISDDKQMTINTSITVYNPISSQQSILEKFGTIVSSKNKSLYQLLYMYFFTGINCDNIRTKLQNITNAKNYLCVESPTESKKDLDNAIIEYSKIFNPSRVENFVYLFTQVMTILLDQAPTEIDIPRISRIVYIEMQVNSKRDDIIGDQGGGKNTIDTTVVSQEGGADDDYLAYAKIVPMQISERNTGPNDMIVTITQLTSSCDKSLMNDDDDDANELDIQHDFKKINISVGDAIRFVKDGKIVYGIICGFKGGKKKHLGGESNTNIQDYWTSSASFVGEDAEPELYKLTIDEIVSIINLRGIIYVEFEYENDNGYPYCDSISNEEGKGKIKFSCSIDKDLWMLPNGYNPSPVKSIAKGLSAFADSFKIGKSTPFGLGNYGKIQYSLRAYMTLDKVNLPSNFKEFSQDLKQLQPYGVNNNYIPQLGGLINKYSLNDDCGRYGMKMTDVASLQIASNFKRKVDETNRNYSFQMQPSGFDIVKSNKFISEYLLKNPLLVKELQDTIYGTNIPPTNPRIPKLIYGLMLKSPDYVTSMKLIFSALSTTDDTAIQKIITGIGGNTEGGANEYDEQRGGASGDKIKDLIDALIDIIRSQKLLPTQIIDQLSSGLESAFSQSHDPESLKTSLASLAKVSKSGQLSGVPQKITSAASALASQGSALASQGSALASQGTNMMKSLFSSSGQTGNVSIGSGSCGDAKVMCDENGIIQVQINLQDLLNNCFPSNGVVGEEAGGNMTIVSNNSALSPIIESPPQQDSQSTTQSASSQAGLSDSFSPSVSVASVQQPSSSTVNVRNVPADQQTAIDAVNNAYLTYYNLYAKIQTKNSSPRGTGVGGSGNSTNDSIQIGGGLEDYIKDDKLPTNTINTQYPDEENARYKGVCRNQVPFLCGNNTQQKGFCRRNEADCTVSAFENKTVNDNYVYQKPTDKDNDQYLYRAYFDRAEGKPVDEPELQSDSTLMSAMTGITGINVLQKLIDAKTQYDTSLSEYMPIATRINILEEYVKSITVKEGSAPTDLQKTALDLATKDLQALKLQSTSSSSEAVSLDVSKVNEASSVFINALTSIESEFNEPLPSASLSSPQLTSSSVASSSADLTSDNIAKIEQIKKEYNKIIVYLSTFIDKFCSRTNITGNNIDSLTETFEKDLDTDLETLKDRQPFENFILGVKLLEDMINISIKVFKKTHNFNTKDAYCKALKEIVILYKSLSDDLTDSGKYKNVINKNIIEFIRLIVYKKKLNFKHDKFTLESNFDVVTKGGSRSSRKINSRKKNHRKSSSKARKSRRNTKSSVRSKNYKKVRFVKTS